MLPLLINSLIWTCRNPQKILKSTVHTHSFLMCVHLLLALAMSVAFLLHIHVCQIIQKQAARIMKVQPKNFDIHASCFNFAFIGLWSTVGCFIYVFISHLYFFCELSVHILCPLFPWGVAFLISIHGVWGKAAADATWVPLKRPDEALDLYTRVANGVSDISSVI